MNEELLVTTLVEAFETDRPVDRAFFGNRRNACSAYGFDFVTVELALIARLANRHVDMSTPRSFTLEN